MSGSGIAMPQKHEAAAARKLCLCATCMSMLHDPVSPTGSSRDVPHRLWCGMKDHPRERSSLTRWPGNTK
eukprot:4453590-Pleurochrysis_carterae.AAC.1